MHRVLTYTIFARGDSNGNVRIVKIFLLWAIITRHQVDSAKFIIEHMRSIAGSKRAGEIVIRGLIIPIALYYEIDLTGLERAKGQDRPTRVEIPSLIKTKIIMHVGKGYKYIFRDLNIFLLPKPDGHQICKHF